ncbi:unnamed protein product [Tilletia controversa]|nr:hypothetical protein CF328_g7929 [Tilletia controversa]CAD6924324.1 unnamed protein product [Tilletia controversa]CAD6974731.1 unnamed protein product [Tilletia controversa]
MWSTIAVIFDLDNDETRGKIRRDILSLFMHEHDDATAHVNACMRLLLRARAADWVLTDDEKRQYFLESMPSSFDNVELNSK